MTDEVELLEQEQVPVEVVEEVVEAPVEREFSEEESVAMTKGWNPEYDGMDKIDAGEFLRREPLFKKISELSKSQKETARILKETIEYNRRLSDISRAKELKALDDRRREAVSIGDEEAFSTADKAYMERMSERVDLPATPQEISDADRKAFTEFRDRNASWTDASKPENTRMLQAADQVYALLLEELPGKSTKEYLAMTEEKMKGLFSHKFQNQRRAEAVPQVSAGRKAVTKSDLPSYDSLSALQKHQCELYVRSGGKKEEYIQQLKDLGRV